MPESKELQLPENQKIQFDNIADLYIYLYKKGFLSANEFITNIPLILEPLQLRKLLTLVELYKLIIDVPGVIIEFGCNWGKNLVLFNHLRDIFDSSNWHRRVYGFDTFTGFPSEFDKKDGEAANRPDFTNKPKGYSEILLKILEYQLNWSNNRKVPSNICSLCVGDIRETLPQFLKDQPHTVISLAYLDVDLYEPTKIILENILPYMPKGSIIAFDELSHEKWPGETVALQEVLGIKNVKLKRFPWSQITGYFIVGE